jgi:hypothetical protein
MRTHRLSKVSLLFLTVVVLLAACGQPTPSPTPVPTDTLEPTATITLTSTITASPTITPTPALAASDEVISADIQHSLDLLAQAYNDQNPDLLKQAVDQGNAPFRRMVGSKLEDYMKSIYAGKDHFDYRLDKITRRADGLVLAHIQAFGWASADWLYRYVDGHWVLSELTPEEIGKPERKETAQFIFEYYPVLGDINTQVMKLMDHAAVRVKNKLGKLPTEKALVKIYPGYSVDPYSDPNALATYSYDNGKDKDVIEVFAPDSYTFGFYDQETGWQQELEDTLTHEYTHMAHKRAFDNAGHMMDWFVEGLAEYTADSGRISEAIQAARDDQLIPIIDTTSVGSPQDLNHLYTLNNDVSLAYAEGEALVSYITRYYGGMDGMWRFAKAYDDTQDFDKALRQAFGIGFEQFNQNWRVWLKNIQ